MKTKTTILILALLSASPLAANASTLRYDLAGEMQLTMEQEIYAGGRTEAIAGRNFSMTFGIQSAHDDNLLVELSAIRGSYSAHGMNQRLPTSHLTGNEFPLQGDGHSFTTAESDTPPAEVNLGQITDGGLRPSELLAELLPVLPDAPVSVGSTWDTERYTRSLEGWAWAGGMLKRHHEVGSIDQSNGRTVVSVRSLGTAILGAAEGNTGFVGEGTLKQTVDWTFDANSGQLLSLTIEQEASGGASQLPQGAVPVRQITRYEMTVPE
jgi:hypothetical protein